MIGKTISHYKILEKLGQGGMGTVYKAKDTKLGRHVALKFLPPHLSQAEDEKKRFIHEAKAASALDHPNICSIYEINETDQGQMFITMACYEGGSLKEKIKDKRLKIKEVIDIAIQIAQGLKKAHAKKIVHRDIKPANILITEDGVVKIVDFGLAKLAGQTKLTKTGSTLGTVAYMSPEQAQAEEVDHRSDIWALGVILYEMLTGKPPFTGSYEQAVIYSILNEDPKPITEIRSEIPEALGQIVSRALEKKPEKRYQHIKELLDDLEALSAGIVPEEIKTRMRKAKLRKRRKAIFYAGAAGFLIAVVAVLIVITRQAQTIDSIAVLPLKNLTGNTEQEYFVDGVTDELIGDLGQISGLKRVISRTSVMQYKETEKPLSEIARELNVDAIVEGTVYQVGDSIRVRFQLIDVLPEEKNLWGETYKRATSNALVLYNDVAQSITNQIRVRLTNDEKTRFTRTRSVNPEAYEAYLKGMSHWYKLTHADLETALQYFESAVEKDPDYALGWSGIARAWGGLKQMGAVEPGVATPRAKKAIQKALELDSTLAEVHYQLAVQRTWTDWDWVAAEKSFKRALEFNPNYPDALVYYSHLLSYMGRAEEGLVMADKALELDPLNSLYSSISGTLLLIMHRYDEAIERFQPGLRTSPYDPVANSGLQEAYHMKGMYEEALAAAKMSYIGMGLKQLAQLVDTWYEQGGYETAMSLVCKAMEDVAKQVYVSPLFISYSYVFAGKKDRVLDLLEKGYEVGDPNMPYIIEPCFTSLLGEEPRYQELLHKMNLPVGK